MVARDARRAMLGPAAVILSGLTIVPLLVPLAAQDFGDHSSATLTARAWGALDAAQLELALAYTDKCRELYLAEARKQQASLADFAPDDEAHRLWALNDVGTCLFIEGQAHEKAGRTAEAVAAYRRLVDEYGFAQCWDKKGWFWKPAKAAADRIEALEFDTALAE